MCSRTICSRLQRTAALTGIGLLLVVSVRGDVPGSLLSLGARVLAREQELGAAKQGDHATVVLSGDLGVPDLRARSAVRHPRLAPQPAVARRGEEVRLQLDGREPAGPFGEGSETAHPGAGVGHRDDRPGVQELVRCEQVRADVEPPLHPAVLHLQQLKAEEGRKAAFHPPAQLLQHPLRHRGSVTGDTAAVSSDDVIARFQPAYDAASRGDLEAWLEMLDPDVEIHQSPALVGTKGTFRGWEGAVQVMAELYDAFEWIDWLPKRGYELGPGRYAVLLKPVGRGKGSGVEVESE